MMSRASMEGAGPPTNTPNTPRAGALPYWPACRQEWLGGTFVTNLCGFCFRICINVIPNPVLFEPLHNTDTTIFGLKWNRMLHYSTKLHEERTMFAQQSQTHALFYI